MHQVSVAILLRLVGAQARNPAFSNLTFGTGGKDKDGKNVTGWGYYEVSRPPLAVVRHI